MDITPNIIIIGAGLIGLCTAEALTARGARVTVIDAKAGPCEGTSFSNSGMIHPSQAQNWDSGCKTQALIDAARRTVELGARSRSLLLAHIKRLGLPVRRDGCLKIYPDLDSARAAQSSFQDIGVLANIISDPIDTFGQTACHFPNDSSGDARAFGCALAADLDKRGVTFIYGAADVKIRRDDGAFAIDAAGGILKADDLVIAAGIHSPDLLAQLDIKMQLKAVSGMAMDFTRPVEADDLPYCPVMDAASRSALTVFEDRIRIAGGWNLTDSAPLIDRWTNIAPELMQRLGKPITTWTGIRPVSPAGRPYISQTSLPKLWVNTGHGHMGWTLCAGSGELMAKMILESHLDGRFVFSS